MSIFGPIATTISRTTIITLTTEPVLFINEIVAKYQLNIDVIDHPDYIGIFSELSDLIKLQGALLNVREQHRTPVFDDARELDNSLLSICVSGDALSADPGKSCNNNDLEPVSSLKSTVQTSSIGSDNLQAKINPLLAVLNKKLNTHTKDRCTSHKVMCGFCNSLSADKHKLKEHIILNHLSITEILSITDRLVLSDNCINSVSNITTDSSASLESVAPSDSSGNQFQDNVTDSSDNVNKYICVFCQKRFDKKKKLKQHIKIHSTQMYPCGNCGKEYKLHSSLLTHQKHKHNPEVSGKRLVCSKCTKSFTSTATLKQHYNNLHSASKKLFTCETCGKNFSYKRSYEEHVNIHSGVKRFVCDVCGKAFTHSKSIKRHRLQHCDNYNYHCEVCNKQFKNSSGLYVHRKVHNNIRNYTCTYCQLKFTQKSSLVRHERIHSGSKPYTCELCDANFRDLSVLRRHLLMVHKQTSSNWKDHVKSQHKITSVEHQTTQSSDMCKNNITLPILLIDSAHVPVIDIVCSGTSDT